ncbi:hypothetical protein [Nonlabens sp.]|uniref:hypothetical protein n=1 Tax=Nonlabens sp. TaxID=1888209 RepID=UPI003F695A3D
MVKTVSYQHTNSYEILHPVTANTENIWICFHGLGYLATYFKRYFQNMDAAKMLLSFYKLHLNFIKELTLNT